MLTRDPLPVIDHDPSQSSAASWLAARWQDLRESFRGSLRDPLHVQLPRHDRRMNMALVALLSIMLYVGAIALLAHYVLDHAAGGLDQSLQARVTFEVLPDTVHPQDRKSMDDRAGRLLLELRRTAGVASAEIMDEGRMAMLLEPWLGTRARLDDLPLPVLIDVKLDPARPAPRSVLEKAGSGIPGIGLDDHQRFQSELYGLVASLRQVGLSVLGLAFLSVLLTSFFAAQATFHINREVIELLHLIGAEDSAIAQHVGLSVLRLALVAAGVALGLALLTLIGLWAGSSGLNLSFFPNFSISLGGWMGLVAGWLVMGLAALVCCLLSVRFTVLRALKKLF